MCLEVNAHWLETNKWYIINILCIHALTLYSYKSRNPLYKIFRKLLNYLIFFEFRANSILLPIHNPITESLWFLSLWPSKVKYIRRKCVFLKIFSESRNIKNINSVNVKNNNGIKISYTKIFNFFSKIPWTFSYVNFRIIDMFTRRGWNWKWLRTHSFNRQRRGH